jgi:hypothetical protein
MIGPLIPWLNEAEASRTIPKSGFIILYHRAEFAYNGPTMWNPTLLCRAALGCAAGVLLMAAYSRTQAVPAMTDAAKNFVNSLWDEQKGRAVFKLEDDERTNWFYTPVVRKGLPLREMSPGQRQLAMALISAGLTQRGFSKAVSIMSLDEVLRAMQGDKPPRRDSDGYFITIFGEPSEKGTWGYRVEGHHLSLHFTIVDGKLAGAPTFLGSNPAEVLDGRSKGLRVLAREDDLSRDFLSSLDASQMKTAIVEAKAPADILTVNSREAALKGQANGLQVSSLNAGQRARLDALLDEYCDNVVPEVAAYRREQIKQAGSNMYFAWMGGTGPRDPRYYRIQTQTFLIEFDDTQDNANHIHSVWRDYKGDFGRDLLKDHYAASH